MIWTLSLSAVSRPHSDDLHFRLTLSSTSATAPDPEDTSSRCPKKTAKETTTTKRYCHLMIEHILEIEKKDDADPEEEEKDVVLLPMIRKLMVWTVMKWSDRSLCPRIALYGRRPN